MNLKHIGKLQARALWFIYHGGIIVTHNNGRRMTHELHYGGDTIDMPDRVLVSIVSRGIMKNYKIYYTDLPSTETKYWNIRADAMIQVSTLMSKR